ncbi:MAG: carbohydrate ABC transporter substrate-binding protein [Mogibacterium sp.]|nr:carbohydrate ABC transporter substrate-binding protein [Mogibacterium sp.]
MAMSVMLLAGCGGSSGGEETGNTGSTDGITVFNSKMEIQDQLLEMAKKYEKETGVHVEVYYSSDTVSAHLATRYASDNPYTLSMVDAKDIYSLAEEHAADLSGEEWVKDTEYAIDIGGKTYGFPVCVEARGIIYNADAIEKITGKKFDPEQYKTLKAFKGLIEELKKGGMEAPTGVMKEDWSLGAHYLAQVYEEQEDPDAFLMDLSKDKVKLMKNEKFNSLMDTFDVLKDNNYARESAISAEREISEKKLAEGEIAFMFGGNWDWSQINQFDYTENMGIMPVPQDMDDGMNEKLVGGGSKYFFIDSSANTTDEQRQQAKDFLNWLVYNENGQSFLVNDCALVPAFSNIKLPISDPLGASVSKYTNAGKLIPNYNYLPDDHFAILGAMFQKYLAGISDREGFAKDVETYWHTKTLERHPE